MRASAYEKCKKILLFLKNKEEWSWIRQIAKNTGIKPYNVSYLIDRYLWRYLDVVDTSDVYGEYGLKVKLVRLKPGINVENVLKALREKLLT